jgi:NAD(P)-dependent dehydrogenase (short-subunit alcohol dehydrogenase family)
MTGRLEGKVAVITGGASGIGEMTVRRFLDEGARIVIADLQSDRGSALTAELGSSTRFIHTDVTREENIAAAIDLAVNEFGQLDIMFNNAGVVGAIGPIADTTAQAWDSTIAILINGAFYGMKHAARVMIPRRSGCILSTSSIAGVIGGLGPHAYTTAKTAIVGLTKSVSSELSSHGIRVNAIAPGNTVSAMTAAVVTGDHQDLAKVESYMQQQSALGVACMPIDIANTALYLASDDARVVTGQTIVVDGGQTTNGGSARFHQSTPAFVAEAGKRSPTF